MIGDLLVKLATQKTLSAPEKQRVYLWTKQKDQDHFFLESTRNGTGNIDIGDIRAMFGEFRFQPYGLSSKIKFSATIPSGANGASVIFTESIYDELRGFTVSSSEFTIKNYGWYEIIIFCDWEQNGAGFRRCDLSGSWGGIINDTIHSSVSGPLTYSKKVITRPLSTNYQTLSMACIQNSGSDLVCSGTVRIQLLAKSPVFTD